jgi:recombination DNA repair RAD52 pathway protein
LEEEEEEEEEEAGSAKTRSIDFLPKSTHMHNVNTTFGFDGWSVEV